MNKYQESLNGIKYLIESEWGTMIEDENDLDYRNIKTLQELVDRATPKEPTNKQITSNRLTWAKCQCGNRLNDEELFCSHCGQKIDWSEDE